ncbi:hypothetical protein HBH98_174050 [Parastagonospora nodorum]|nr:hypothetical protein HBI09_034780 [Parastagonospora nodorum]KAH4180524.1 hypothetical protein HBH43_005440 [Parastagonospora nodorum]KAH4341636.1 hypothetical protein HBH98_174050 [Parastagonospora nodorum]KAH4369917.1 hypothetical protein HBH97_146020 [Parastagonospora nodorum]KAH4387738.1 hypothetical protein HBH99_166010 [Parastagonospora nodorum]
MSSKLDTSLDDILKTRRQTKGPGRGRGGRRSDAARPAPSGPVGGVGKSTRPVKQPKAAPAAAVIPETNGKILVSGLPHDVDQNQLQDYFATAVGVRPKKVLLQYGPTGRSLGSATIIFNKHEQAVKATSALNGVKIDGRPIRVEMLVSAANLGAAAAQPSLAERVTQPKKDKPKPANAAKTAPAAAGKGRGRGGRAEARGGRGGRNPRERTKKKTVEELDAEMADYFPAGEGSTDVVAAGGAEVVQTTTAVGDTAMDDEML